MLLIANEVDSLIFHCVCFVCNTNMYFSNTLNHQEDQNLVAQFFDNDGNWTCNNLSFILPHPLLDAINAISTNTSSPCEDLIAWCERSGKFRASQKREIFVVFFRASLFLSK